jgi:hypothetical protein
VGLRGSDNDEDEKDEKAHAGLMEQMRSTYAKKSKDDMRLVRMLQVFDATDTRTH